jgi:uncharacterized protein (DUF362 family)/Pyruvate/2-oxoacid:ferredoxin oxidoreductase delta subunit
MEKSKVSLMRCESYDETLVYNAAKKGVDLIGGIAHFVKPGEKIVLKPNILLGAEPGKCVCTHPSVLKAIGKILKEVGANVYYGDSPSVGKCEWHVGRAGLKQAAEELGIKLADFNQGREVVHKDALINKRFVIANGVLDTDGLISLPKLKTHQLTRLTGAVKNQFGCIPGILKTAHHLKIQDPHEFSSMLVDINTLIKPRLYIMDAINAMEGNGPRSGKPKKLGVLLISSDPVALDAVACRIVAFDPEMLPTSKPGKKAGLGTYLAEEIELLGDDINSFIDPSFDMKRKPPASVAGGPFLRFLKNRTMPRPVIDEAKCTKCGTCVNLCPAKPKAVDWKAGDKKSPPVYHYKRCIRCYCCQESCPEEAIAVKEPVLGKIFFRQ